MSQEDFVPAYSSPNAGTKAITPGAATADERRKMGRRALIAAAGLGVVGIAVAEKDNILNGVGNLASTEIQNAINAGRKALAQELVNLEGVAVTGAEDAANITYNAVNAFVLPIADLLAGIGEVTLSVASFAVEKAQQFTQLLHIDITALQTLDGILKGWQQNVAAFPTVVASLNNSEHTAAVTYLTKLKATLEREGAQT
jgi:hypothetical protein